MLPSSHFFPIEKLKFFTNSSPHYLIGLIKIKKEKNRTKQKLNLIIYKLEKIKDFVTNLKTVFAHNTSQ